MRRIGKNGRGFTLMELLIAVAIVAVLVAVSIPVFSSALKKSKEATCAANRRSLKSEVLAAWLAGDYDSPEAAFDALYSKTDFPCPFGGTFSWSGGESGTVVCDHETGGGSSGGSSSASFSYGGKTYAAAVPALTKEVWETDYKMGVLFRDGDTLCISSGRTWKSYTKVDLSTAATYSGTKVEGSFAFGSLCYDTKNGKFYVCNNPASLYEDVSVSANWTELPVS